MKDVKEKKFPLNLMEALCGSTYDFSTIPNTTSDTTRRLIHGIMECALTKQECEVINFRFCGGFTLKKIGELLEITPERVRQIEAKALRKMRFPSNFKMIRGIIGDISDDIVANAVNAFGNYILCTNVKTVMLIDELTDHDQAVAYRLIKNNRFIQSLLNGNPHNIIAQLSDTYIEPKNPDKDIPITCIGLSVGTLNALQYAGIHNVSDIINKSRDDLLAIRNISDMRADEIITKVSEAGYIFNIK